MSVVIVTGGTFGIGKAITIESAKRGHQVVAFGLDTRQNTSLAENGTALVHAEAQKLGLAVDALEADVSKADDVRRVVDFTVEKHGRIDALINNAAIGPLGTILETSEELWDRVIDVNLKGYYLMSKAVLPHMISQGGGSIINVGSGAGWGKPNMFAYATSKGGIFALSSALAYDHFHQHIRVNAVVPGGGGLATGMSEGRRQTGTVFPQYGFSGNVSGRQSTPEDIAYTVCFLLSPEAEIITGGIFDVGCFAHQGGPVPPLASAVKENR
jgi:NAD(P)-dependent dehydrogenase (short-subunit alcohol dehydrogenase family)